MIGGFAASLSGTYICIVEMPEGFSPQFVTVWREAAEAVDDNAVMPIKFQSIVNKEDIVVNSRVEGGQATVWSEVKSRHMELLREPILIGKLYAKEYCTILY
jgi:hypothetical protein